MKNLFRLMILGLLLAFAFTFPYQTWAVYESIYSTKCEPNGTENANTAESIRIKDLCQRCAKFTKSATVYPMCCTNQDDVLNWCVKADSFGTK